MTVPGTQLHIVTFFITTFECVILLFQMICCLSRPGDKNRKRYLILLILLIQYNLFSGLMPDKNFALPMEIQIILAYFGGISVSMYFVFYIYKTFELEKLKVYAIQGSLLCIFLPFIVLFIVPFMITGDLYSSRRLIVIAPIIFTIFFVYTLTKSLWNRYRENANKVDRGEIIGVYLGVLLWATLPVIVYFDGSQVVENSITNAGFLIMSVLFVRSSIIKSKMDDHRMKESELELKKLNGELKSLNVDLQNKVEVRTRQLEEVNEQRLHAFINLVHETKTPLTLINNYLDGFIEKYCSKEELEITKMSLDKLNRNMTNFFDITKLERGVYIYDHSITSDFSDILVNAVKVFRPWAKSKNIEITSEIAPEIYIKADPEAIDSINYNLLENAIKYTNENGLIKVGLKRIDDQIYFGISDNGRGISKEHQSKIFQPYYQVNHKKSNTQGIGMGLSIVKKTVESLGGKIEFVSRIGIGTKITIILTNHQKGHNDELVSPKVNKYSIKHYCDREIKDQISDPDKKYLLVVEDNLDLLNYWVNKLKVDYNVFAAQNGNEAIARLTTIPIPDLILSDIMMDGMDGIELIKALRRQTKYQHIPVIFLTAKTNHKDKMQGLKHGAIDFISKPVKFLELKYKIDSILSTISNQKDAIVSQAFRNLNNGQDNDAGKLKKVSFEERCEKLRLTKRESEVANLLIHGKTYKKIGEALFISEKTVSRHASNIFFKVGVKSKFELMNRIEDYEDDQN